MVGSPGTAGQENESPDVTDAGVSLGVGGPGGEER
jgi:hypothetical protein